MHSVVLRTDLRRQAVRAPLRPLRLLAQPQCLSAFCAQMPRKRPKLSSGRSGLPTVAPVRCAPRCVPFPLSLVRKGESLSSLFNIKRDHLPSLVRSQGNPSQPLRFACLRPCALLAASLRSPGSDILALWSSHCQVNHRPHGADSADPYNQNLLFSG